MVVFGEDDVCPVEIVRVVVPFPGSPGVVTGNRVDPLVGEVGFGGIEVAHAED